MACPECEAQRSKYGFALEDGNFYMTKVPEVKACCPVKVYVERHNATQVFFTCENKEYVMEKTLFMKSSWRLYDSY